MIVALLIACAVIFTFAFIFTIESIHEKEPRSPIFGAIGVGVSIVLALIIIFIPGLRESVAILFGIGVIAVLLILIPGKPYDRAIKGGRGHIVGDAKRFDERNIVFARFRIGLEGADKTCYQTYYTKMNPEKEEADAVRREKGFLGGREGAIDNQYPPNISMLHSSFDMPEFLGPYTKAIPEPDQQRVQITPERATEIVKNYAKYIGADLVGICKVDPLWVYSHRGEIHFDNWDDWGKELNDYPPYALVMCTEMNWEHVSSAPHTPTVAESAGDYARGAYLSVYMARWFMHMGYRGVAQNTRNYDTVLPPLAVDAGLGEIGRNGYLIAPKYGARVRVFATLTDMPLIPDKPITIGADEFCRKCKKCGESCPSKSILLDEKVIHNGIEKWKIKEDTCFDYWSKVGTDCNICMAVCPFSRPDTFSHRIVRYLVARSYIAKTFFPYIDNVLYGKKWRPRKVSSWLDWTNGGKMKKEVY